MSVLRDTTGQKWKCNKEGEKTPAFQTEIQHHRTKAQFQVTNSATNASHGTTVKKSQQHIQVNAEV